MLLLLLACSKTTPNADSGDVPEVNYDVDGDGYLVDEDCDDNDGTVWPGAIEVCDGVDQDCDDLVDEGVLSTFYRDADEDGDGSDEDTIERCDKPDGYVNTGGDCDDDDADIHPNADEICDGIDQDCDDLIDEGELSTFWADADADGYGDPAAVGEACEAPEGFVDDATDCDDTNAEAFPGNPEVCDEADNDCNGSVDEGVTTTFWVDVDVDGYGDDDLSAEACALPTGYAAVGGDCDDADDTRNPGATEGVADGVDQDCDDEELCYEDVDVDGHGTSSTTSSMDLDCVDSGESETADDCDDADDTRYPGADEYCDDADDDCDGTVDEGAVDGYTWFADSDTDGYGDPSVSTSDCDQPSGYVSDDSDCDDTDGDLNPDTVWYADTDTDGYGDALSTTTQCLQPTGYVDDDTDCDDGDGDSNPGASEVCDAADNDCDGSVDEGVLGTGASCPAEDCAEILADDPTAADGSYTLDAGTYTCDMTTDGGGWTLVGDDAVVYGTTWDTSYYNSEGFTYTEALFTYVSGSVSAHCTYPGSLTSCNNLGFQFGSESWGVALNYGSSVCSMALTDYTGNTSYIGGYDFVIDRSSSTDTLRLGSLEGIAGCTTSDNSGTAYVDIFVR
ncbi:MAG: hypothetical protein GY913_22720 [Proteobacteria bacterium]|nr:hypothetical protein [Pseudomonadota bacterium]MCP4919724.1 hypothetical protein [Pseudomonadota bacterium]